MAQCERTLYHFPGSYFSLRAILTLYEKQLPFNDHIVNIGAGEQLTDSYLKINPKGLVPVLKDGNKLIPESEDIIDYLDKTYNTGTVLVPDESTPFGRDVKQMRQFLNDIKIEVITYGVMLHRRFSVKGLQFSGPVDLFFNKKAVDHKFSSAIQIIDAKLANTSDAVLRDALQKKRTFNITFRDTINDPDKVAAILDGLDSVFDKLETQLESSQKKADVNSDYWLLGVTYTVADIYAANLFFRLYQLGVDERYYSATKRPLVHAYNGRLLARQSVVKMRAVADGAFRFLIRRKVKTVAIRSVKVLTVAGLVGLGSYGVWKLFSRNT